MPAEPKASQSSHPKANKDLAYILQTSMFVNYRALPRGAGMLISRLQTLQPSFLPCLPPQLIPAQMSLFSWGNICSIPHCRIDGGCSCWKEAGRKAGAGGLRLDVSHSKFIIFSIWTSHLGDTKPYTRSAASELLCLTVVHMHNFLPGVFCKG